MLKIKDTLDFNRLKKMGFIKAWTGMWVLVDNDNYIIAEINPVTRELDTDDSEIINKLEKMVEKVEDK